MSTPLIEESKVTVLPNGDDLVELFPYEEPTDKNAKAHVVMPTGNEHIWNPGMTAQDLVDLARFTSQEIVALCGYKWVPKLNPDKCDICETCLQIMKKMDGE